MTCGFIVLALKMYPIFENTFAIHGTFYIYSGILLLSLPLVYYILPETKDMGLEMIQSYFTPNKTVFYVDLEVPQKEIPKVIHSVQN